MSHATIALALTLAGIIADLNLDLEAAQQIEDQNHDQNGADNPTERPVAPARRVRPDRHGTNQQKHEDDNQNGGEHDASSIADQAA